MKTVNKNSHLTAKKRDKRSYPMYWLHKNGHINGEVLDFGCGHGEDIKFLDLLGFDVTGYDKYYENNYPNKKFDTITCIYVLNVMDSLEQSQVLMSVSELLKPGGTAFFVVRRDIKKEGYRTHYVYKKPTYQTNVKLPFKSIYNSDSCEIYEYKHFNLAAKEPSDCVFCIPEKDILLENALSYSVFDKFPVSKGHTLIITKTHKSNYFELTLNEQFSLTLIINRMKRLLDEKYNPDGYNVGVNIGELAGQTINHVHIHLIPRYKNDVENPVGGVRNVIPEKGDYLKLNNRLD